VEGIVEHLVHVEAPVSKHRLKSHGVCPPQSSHGILAHFVGISVGIVPVAHGSHVAFDPEEPQCIVGGRAVAPANLEVAERFMDHGLGEPRA